MEILDIATELSHEFGTPEHVKAGGGNTSAKDADTLWIKASGTTLADLTADSFVAMDRAKLAKLYDAKPPADAHAREAMVKDMMMAAVRPGVTGRPSVEAPLHNSFGSVFVVHTHPVLVNGMTCSKTRAEVCRELFPDDVWAGSVDPGYTMSMEVRRKVKEYVASRGHEPRAVFMENHGFVVAGDAADDVRGKYSEIMNVMAARYAEAGVSTVLKKVPDPSEEEIERVTVGLREVLGADAEGVAATGTFEVAAGPLTPDHIVYMKAYALAGEPTAEAVLAFRQRNGYMPRVISCGAGVFGVGTNQKNAETALELALDGALVVQLAGAFGGAQFMSDSARDFIDNWEVEAYRRKLAGA
jgi:rhamnulokinase